jgi:tRNA(Ile2)-agmatinylcytidine synthase
LVRLNPNIPWKTRGNGAISIQTGKAKGKKKLIGEIRGKPIYSYSKNNSMNVNMSNICAIVEEIVSKHAKLDDKNTNSGLVLSEQQPSFSFYSDAVTDVLTVDDAKNILNSNKAYYKGFKNSRGIIGATASIAWKDQQDITYELITYREEDRWGSKRYVDDESTKKMDKQIKSTFDNFDYKNNHNRLVPNSPCPVLFGIRGDNDKDLYKAKSMIKSEEINSWLIFQTNQGTDNHLLKKMISNIKLYQSVIVEGVINNTPRTIEGGHVIFSIKDKTGEIDCAAYEPTKEFRNIIRELIVGDKLEVYGGVREKPLTINLEKINVLNLEKHLDKIENPVCPNCGKHMKSKGTGQGFKCKRCGTKENKPVLQEKKRNIKLGFFEVPVCARRHISKPLKRYNHKAF